MKRSIFLQPLKWYQYISKLTPASCRYYPSCSEYSKWLFDNSHPLSAAAKSALRIASCNQLFPGGIDYPKIAYKKPKVTELYNPLQRACKASAPLKFKPFHSTLRIHYWFLPVTNSQYAIVKDFDATATYLPAGYAPPPSPR